MGDQISRIESKKNEGKPKDLSSHTLLMAMSLLAMATPPSEGGGQLESMMQSEKQRYCLKWNNYQANVTTTFKELLAVEDFVDITLSAEGGALKAHKVVLSACSPYFRDILKVNNHT